MEDPLGKLYNMPIIILLVIGTALSVFLFYSMMKAAENGNVMMVILLAIAVSIVAFVVSRALKMQTLKKM